MMKKCVARWAHLTGGDFVIDILFFVFVTSAKRSFFSRVRLHKLEFLLFVRTFVHTFVAVLTALAVLAILAMLTVLVMIVLLVAECA